MKVVCNFCKTEYSMAKVPVVPVQCAICGHTWTVSAPKRRNSFLIFVAAICALLSAAVFVVAILSRHQTDVKNNNPLVATISNISTVVDAFGDSHFVVRGSVLNKSTEIYGVPDLLIISRDAAGNIISQQKFMPSATLLDAGASVEFSHTLSATTNGVKKITLELRD